MYSSAHLPTETLSLSLSFLLRLFQTLRGNVSQKHQGLCGPHRGGGLSSPVSSAGLEVLIQALSDFYFSSSQTGLWCPSLCIIIGMSQQRCRSNLLYGEGICRLAITAVMIVVRMMMGGIRGDGKAIKTEVIVMK